VNGALLEAFRHSWATRQLLAFCRDRSEEQLAASATGTYGSIRAACNHPSSRTAATCGGWSGGAPAWVDRPEDADLDELAARAGEAGQLWERLLAEPASSSPRRFTTGTRTGSRSAPS
jgi:uncharacterized damage-inducible protein DinB